ncbi:ABC transporter permease [Granulicatella seriolae]|uniref:Iron export ABC transporter permease subunit FetB n=1 Tax=Granulicatella seriolae TaxID=2967226 RepID=A0ABT1WLX0_9LACT|nr:iron export ABC transporter permease subunit FetB [Granulicatella seriolae]
MNLAISPQTLVLTASILLIAIWISYKEKLGTSKEIIISIGRAIIQLLVVGYVLTYIFDLNNAIVTLALVLIIIFNASWNAGKRGNGLKNAFRNAFISIFTATAITLIILLATGSIVLTPGQVVPITGMIAGNAMTNIGLNYRNLMSLFRDQSQQVQEKLALGANSRQASLSIMQDAIKAGMQPTLDTTKTVGLVSLPGMMSGLIFAGIEPTKAVMYQIMVMMMLIGTTAIASYISTYLTYKSFYTDRQQLIINKPK